MLDIGANVGSFTVPFARKVGDSGKVLAFEPQSMLANMLGANAVINLMPRIFVQPYAVGDVEGFVQLDSIDYFSKDSNFGAYSFKNGPIDSSRAERIPQKTLDSMFGANDPCPNFIKMDIEGMEYEAMLGAKHMIKRCKPAMIFENNNIRVSELLLPFLLELDYDLYWTIDPIFESGNFFGNAENVFSCPTCNSIDILCLVNGGSPLDGDGYPLMKVQKGKYLLTDYVNELSPTWMKKYPQITEILGQD